MTTLGRGGALREVVICEPVRTPIGRYGGVFKHLDAVELAVAAVKGLMERTGLPPEAVSDVVLGHCNASGEAPAIGRVVALDAGLPVSVPGQHVDRRCGSGLQAVINAAMAVQTGVHDVVIAGGTESMSQAPFYSLDLRWGAARTGVQVHDTLTRARTTAGGRSFPMPNGMLETAENLRRSYAIPRDEQDALALESHRRAVRAQQDGIFAEEIIPVLVPGNRGSTLIELDEHPRPDVTLQALSRLRPILNDADDEATVTAGNASGQNDGAAVCIVTTSERALSLGLRPLVRLLSWAAAGVDPRIMGVGPVAASAEALGRAGLSLQDMDMIELNEAFAVQALAVMREWRFDDEDRDRTNVHGSGISLGHPVGATGARILATLAREMSRREARYGLETMCIGGGQGLAAVFERVAG